MPSPGKMQKPRYRGKREPGGKTPFENPGRRPAVSQTAPGKTITTTPAGAVPPVGGKPPFAGAKKGSGKGFGPGGRFGKGGWQRKAQAAAFSYTDRQNAEAEQKKRDKTERLKSAAERRLKTKKPTLLGKTGPNSKQSQLLGEE